MKATELRIGNYYKDGIDRIGRLTKWLSSKKVEMKMEFSKLIVGYEELEPIPLTEEWLLKFGFHKHHGEYYNETIAIWEKGYLWYFSIYPLEDMEDELPDMSAHRTGHYVKCVHQLQNLYHALTGEELNLKP